MVALKVLKGKKQKFFGQGSKRGQKILFLQCIIQCEIIKFLYSEISRQKTYSPFSNLNLNFINLSYYLIYISFLNNKIFISNLDLLILHF